MPPAILALKTYGTGQVQAGRLVGTTFTQIGNDIPDPLDNPPDANNQHPVSRIIQFKNEVYCWQGNSIRKYNSGTSNWDLVHTLNPKINAATTIAAGSDGATLPQATVNVADTTGFGNSGQFAIVTSAGVEYVTYTGKTATTFTGCTGGTGTMSTGGTVTYRSGEEVKVSGLFIFYINNVAYLGGVYSSSTIGVYRIRTTDGSSWSTAQLSNSIYFSNTQGIRSSICSENIIYMGGQAGDTSTGIGHWSWDPSTDALTRVSADAVACPNSGTVSGQPQANMTWKGRLFKVAAAQSNFGNIQLMEYSAGSWTSRGTLQSAVNQFNQRDSMFAGAWCLFAPNDGFLYAVFGLVTPGLSNLQSERCFRITDNGGGSYTFSDISTTVFPTSLTNQTLGNNSGTQRMSAYVDTDTDPTTPVTYLYFATDSASTLTQYQWNGSSSQVTSLSTGGSVTYALPYQQTGGGEYTWTSGELDVIITGVVGPIAGGERIKFRLYGGGTNRKVKFYRQPSTTTLPTSLATIANPSSGTVVSNEIQGLTADGSEYQVDWLASSDSVANGTTTTLIPWASV